MRDILNGFLNRFSIKSIESESEAVVPSLYGNSVSYSRCPNWIDGESRFSESKSIYPPLFARILHDVVVNPSSVAIVKNQSILLPNYFFRKRDRYDFTGGFVRKIRKNYVKLNQYPAECASDGIALFGLGSSNWYHWLVEILPCAMLAQSLPHEHDHLPFLVPEECAQVKSFEDALASISNSRSIVTMRHDRMYRVKNLIAIDSPVRMPFNVLGHLWPRPVDFEQHTDVLNDFRTAILKYLGIERRDTSRRIFLARGNSRREYNQEEILCLANDLNLEIVFPERLSFREQVSLFYHSKLIVGASGAAWANLIFCQRGALGLTWIFKEYSGFSTYMNLAAISGVTLRYIEAKSDKPLKSSWEAYGASYRLCPSLLMQGVRSLCNLYDSPGNSMESH
jgi:hypothetical protein